MQVKKSKQIDGVSFVFSKTEFDLLANVLRKVNLLDTDPNMKKTLQALENYSYFDLENKQVHTNLGYSELGAAMLALMIPLMIPNDDAEKSIFEELSSKKCQNMEKNEIKNNSYQ